ncbi:adhesin [Streptomyces sp. 7N604]|uniref:adhesin n=1 Tax=Streptomyces sp. 7N604 TaxID=3457415 RepID=UPI003FD0C3F0
MACERCGGQDKPSSGRPCACRFLVSDPSDPWITRDTLYGRWTTLSGPRKVAVAAGALLALSTLVGVVLLTESPAPPADSDSRTEQAGPETELEAPKPSLILPTGEAAEPAPSPSRSSKSPKPKPKPTRTPPSTPKPSPKPTREEPAPRPVRITYSAWAGHGCASPEGGGYEEHGNWYKGIEGWFTVRPGGYEGDSCDGSFSSVPMSGDRDRDWGNGAAWWWSVGDDSDRCDVGVYIPRGDDHSVAGNPTTYMVLTDLDGRHADVTTFRIDQIAHRGELVDAGTFRVEGGRIVVKLLDRGQDWDEDGPTYAHHAAGQMKVTCRSG